ncbi:hypothetical protein AQI88_41605 [Streptomyces cellostaticus]|uniref:Uncharacterized protein n=1 Tax=Streptomyces cellostaticus TaxID=67285 RepID=A0A101N397_9ACTN|nr:hypothetical protein [Streptomyces cellostaticus]KUM85752.1 hypothetical protein AQI88_41605 [Streptomyces cellostaticus]GHI10250.1 hypothetical protein Scel_85710 [Streptomyces cellostaticus]
MVVRDAVKVHRNGRCRRAGCRQLFQLDNAEAQCIERIRTNHGLAVHGGMRVAFDDRPGVIVGYQGEYLRVLLDDDLHQVTCPPTDRMTYPEGMRV